MEESTKSKKQDNVIDLFFRAHFKDAPLCAKHRYGFGLTALAVAILFSCGMYGSVRDAFHETPGLGECVELSGGLILTAWLWLLAYATLVMGVNPFLWFTSANPSKNAASIGKALLIAPFLGVMLLQAPQMLAALGEESQRNVLLAFIAVAIAMSVLPRLLFRRKSEELNERVREGLKREIVEQSEKETTEHAEEDN